MYHFVLSLSLNILCNCCLVVADGFVDATYKTNKSDYKLYALVVKTDFVTVPVFYLPLDTSCVWCQRSWQERQIRSQKQRKGGLDKVCMHLSKNTLQI